MSKTKKILDLSRFNEAELEKIRHRFWRRVNTDGPLILDTPCWVWTGYLDRDGYGQIKIRKSAYRATHMALAVGGVTVPAGFIVCHRCDNPACVRTDHLFVGTDADNLRDCWSKGRNRSARSNGLRNGRAKLTDDRVREMRALYATGNHTVRELADRYGITGGTAHLAISRKTWTHVL